MATTLSPPRSPNRVRTPRSVLPRGAAPARRRQLSVIAIGALLILGGALAFTDASLHLGSRQSVLVTTKALSAGQLLSPNDLTTAPVSNGSGVSFITAAEESTVVGRPLAVPVVAGVPITSGEVGAPSSLVSGSDVVAVLLKPGAFPPSLAAGDDVEVIPVPAPGSVTAPTSSGNVRATVLSISAAPDGASGTNVAELEVPSGASANVAGLAAAGEVSLVELGGGS